MQVVVAPMHRLPVVTAILVIDAGATTEPRGKEGVADIVSRALTEGTESRSADELITALERLGTSISASADWESSILKMTVMSPNLPDALDLMAEMATKPRFDAASVERIRAERLSEIIQTRSEPSVLADEMLNAELYGDGSRYGTPLGGSEQSVSRITVDDVREYHRGKFNASTGTLILAGDIDKRLARELAGRSFGSWLDSGNPPDARHSTTTGKKPRQIRVVDRSGAQQSELRMGHIGIPRSVPQYFDIVVMNAVLGGLFSSRINLNLREAHGYTYGASSYFDWRRDAGPFVISSAVQSEVTGAAIAEVMKEIHRIQSEPIAEEELSLATSYLSGVFPIRYETADAVASGLASLVIFGLPDDYFSSYRPNILGVTTDRVQRAAQAFLRSDELSIVVAGNPTLVTAQLEELDLGEVTVARIDE